MFQLLGLLHVLWHRFALLPSSNLILPGIHDGSTGGGQHLWGPEPELRSCSGRVSNGSGIDGDGRHPVFNKVWSHLSDVAAIWVNTQSTPKMQNHLLAQLQPRSSLVLATFQPKFHSCLTFRCRMGEPIPLGLCLSWINEGAFCTVSG